MLKKKEWYLNAGNNITTFIKSRFFAVVVSFILVLLQSVHPAKVLIEFNYFQNSIANIAYSYFMALLIEAFVMYYVLKGNDTVSKYFAGFSIIINLYFYADLLILNKGIIAWNWDFIPAIAFAIMIPIAIYRVAEEI